MFNCVLAIYVCCQQVKHEIYSNVRVISHYNTICHTKIENLSDPNGYLLDFTNPYYTALAGNMKACAKKDNSF